MKSFLKSFLVLCVVGSLAACSSSSEDMEKQVDLETGPSVAVETLYNTAADALDAKEYRKAIGLFQDVEREYPFSVWAKRSELMSAFALYKAQFYQDAIISLDRYISLHPGSEGTDYALYLKALCYYEQISDVERDQATTKDALDALGVLIRRYPESTYARDARLKRDLALDHLAGKEMEIGRYYLTRGHINSAIGRFRIVVQNYQTTTHVAEALYRLIESYISLGLKEEAYKVAAVLGYNYPGSNWYSRGYKLLDDEQRSRIIEERDWMDRTVDSLFNPN
jgi:outer membrane protein assembly factor BamD